jgi:hypothetical protein
MILVEHQISTYLKLLEKERVSALEFCTNLWRVTLVADLATGEVDVRALEV